MRCCTPIAADPARSTSPPRGGSELWLLVADDGDGLQPETDRPGLGLGLGLISQVCDEMAIVARSSGGTEVRIRFDLVPPESIDGRARQQRTAGTDDGRAPSRPVSCRSTRRLLRSRAIRAAPPTD